VKHLIVVEDSGMLSKIVRIGYAAYKHYYKHTHSQFSLIYLTLLDLYDATDITEFPRKAQYTTEPELPLIL
jgi:hypothetical protein